jgi:hypothetical protein
MGKEPLTELRSFGVFLPDFSERLIDIPLGVNGAGPAVEFLNRAAPTNALEVLFGSPSIELADRNAFFLGDGFDLVPNFLTNGDTMSHGGPNRK